MHSRLRPFQILDAEWRRAAWKRWLVSRAPLDPAPAPSGAVSSAAPSAGNSEPEAAFRGAVAAVAQRENETRRAEGRARFDALVDRLAAVEDTLDALGKRFALRTLHDRRHNQRALERLDDASEVLERQTLSLESIKPTVERVEQRLERIERLLRSDGSARDAENRISRTVPKNTSLDDLDELEYALSEPRTGSRSLSSDTIDAWDVPPFSTSSIRGNLAEMSLPTVLAMLELERRTGMLKVCAEDGSVVSATLSEGSIVGARVRELETEPVEAFREALRYRTGHFWFRQASVEIASGPPRSVGSVLLEASRQNDEARRSA